jgi:predicted GH43/DUF377 family glycosyl hydrolase
MVQVNKLGVILDKTKLDFENDGVLNPAVIKVDNKVHIFYRAVARGNYSTVGYCVLNGPLEIEKRLEYPLMKAEFDYESHGVEDPRIVKIDDLYYLSYTAYDGLNALGCVAVSKDLEHFEKKGIVVPRVTYPEFIRLTSKKGLIKHKYYRYNQHDAVLEKDIDRMLLWDKNVVFFPRRINGELCFLHRIKPGIQIVTGIKSLENLTAEFWENYLVHLDEFILLDPKYQHEKNYIGGGCPPIETDQGWLMVYHGVHESVNGYVYCACVALLDLEDPRKEIARLPYGLFKPDQEWELKGYVRNVCFPSGAALFDDTLYIYYGAADERIACASVSLSELLNELLKYTHTEATIETEHYEQ